MTQGCEGLATQGLAGPVLLGGSAARTRARVPGAESGQGVCASEAPGPGLGPPYKRHWMSPALRFRVCLGVSFSNRCPPLDPTSRPRALLTCLDRPPASPSRRRWTVCLERLPPEASHAAAPVPQAPPTSTCHGQLQLQQHELLSAFLTGSLTPCPSALAHTVPCPPDQHRLLLEDSGQVSLRPRRHLPGQSDPLPIPPQCSPSPYTYSRHCTPHTCLPREVTVPGMERPHHRGLLREFICLGGSGWVKYERKPISRRCEDSPGLGFWSSEAGSGQPWWPPPSYSRWSKMTFSWLLLSCNSCMVFCNFFSCSNNFLCSLLISAFNSPV